MEGDVSLKDRDSLKEKRKIDIKEENKILNHVSFILLTPL